MTETKGRIPQLDSEEIHISDYIRVIRKRWFLFLAMFVAVTTVGVVYTFMITPLYQAEIKLEILDMPEQELEILGSFSSLKKDRIETEIEKIRSRDIARKVAKDLKLKNQLGVVKGQPSITLTDIACSSPRRGAPAVFFLKFHSGGQTYSVMDAENNAIKAGTAGLFESESVSFTAAIHNAVSGDEVKLTILHIEDCVESLMRATNVSRIGETGILSISVTHPDPQMAKRIVDQFNTVYSWRNLEEKNASAREVNRFISERKVFYEQKLSEASRDLQAFKEDHNIFSLDSSNSTLISQIAAIETERAVKTVELERLENAVEIIKSDRDEFNAPQIFAPQSASEQLAARLSMLKVTRRQLLNNLTPDHPNVVDIDIQIKEIKKGILDKLASTQTIVQGELNSIGRQLDSYNLRLKALPELDKDMVEKIRNVGFYHQMVLQMATKFEEFSIKEVSTLSSIRVSQASVVPVIPIKPKKMVNIILSLIVAAVAGLGTVFFREYFDNTFISTEDVEEVMDDRVLVTIPYLRKRNKDDVSVDKDKGLAYLSLDSPITEAFKTLKTSVEFLDIGGSSNVYQVTSAISGEGKSTISSNLAITFANSGIKTLLIDADYKKPMQHKIMGCENQLGFIDILYKGVKPLETVQDSGVENLSFISSGQLPAGLSSSIVLDSLEPIIADLRKTYEFILIDTPPLLAIDDSIRIGKLTDGVVLVVALGKVDRNIAKRCVERCRRNGLKISGIAVNDCTETEKYSRGYQYYQYYHYGERSNREPVEDRKWRIYINR